MITTFLLHLLSSQCLYQLLHFTHSTSSRPPAHLPHVSSVSLWTKHYVAAPTPPPPLCVTPDPKRPPVVKPKAPLELSLDLVFPWQHYQWAQSNVSNCLMFPVATVGKHKLCLWNRMLFYKRNREIAVLFLGHILMHPGWARNISVAQVRQIEQMWAGWVIIGLF